MAVIMACFLFFMGRLKESVSAYLRYRLSVQSKYSLHSPFIYKFWAGILKDKTSYPAYGKLESLRKELLKDARTINRLDLGAGSQLNAPASKPVKVREIAKRSLVSPAKGRFLYKLVKANQPASIIELGTSLGLSSLYMAEAASDARIISLEGCPETAAIARSNFKKIKKENITVFTGAFGDKLGDALKLVPNPDLVFFDGNHRREPTLKYFEECLPGLHSGSVAVFDDIHWSGEMEEAWKLIIARPEVKLSIDLYYMGIIYFREELSKEDFVLRF
jgi:predicted O-methyltransferase YrrM